MLNYFHAFAIYVNDTIVFILSNLTLFLRFILVIHPAPVPGPEGCDTTDGLASSKSSLYSSAPRACPPISS